MTNFGIISAFRHEFSYLDNLERHSNLKMELDRFGFDYVEIPGEFEENGAISVKELSFVVSSPDEDLYAVLLDLSIMFRQECFIYKEYGGEQMIVNI